MTIHQTEIAMTDPSFDNYLDGQQAEHEERAETAEAVMNAKIAAKKALLLSNPTQFSDIYGITPSDQIDLHDSLLIQILKTETGTKEREQAVSDMIDNLTALVDTCAKDMAQRDPAPISIPDGEPL